MNKYKNKICIGEGCHGVCYLVENNEVLKIFSDYRTKSDLEKYYHFLKYQNSSINFPTKFITKYSKYLGHISPFIKGLTLDQALYNIPIEDFISMLYKLEQDVNHITKGKILMSDIHSKNIIYSDNKLKFIDVDDYEICNISDDDLLDLNYKRISQMLYDTLANYFTGCMYARELFSEFKTNLMYQTTLSELMFIYNAILEEYTSSKENTIKDYVRILHKKTS